TAPASGASSTDAPNSPNTITPRASEQPARSTPTAGPDRLHVLAAPNLADVEALAAFLATYGPAVQQRDDLGLALLHDPSKLTTEQAVRNLAQAHAQALGSATHIEIGLVHVPSDAQGWNELAQHVDARIRLAGDPRELVALDVPEFHEPAVLAEALCGGVVNLEGSKFDPQVAQRVASLHPWFYPVEIAGHRAVPGIGSPCSPQWLTSRTEHRMRMLVDGVLGEIDVRGKKVLDLASNCGFWSSAWALAGADSVLGIEGRARHVEQAELYWSTNQFLPDGKWRFVQGDVANAADWKPVRDAGPFDVTLCAGILYHVKNWDEILRWAAVQTTETLIVDTRVQDGDEELIDEPGDLHFNAIESTRRKVVPNRARLLAVLEEPSASTARCHGPVRRRSASTTTTTTRRDNA
ncbi:MAG: class I SAM-dependent methyltransferase, partial [Planctomycetota bacterium]